MPRFAVVGSLAVTSAITLALSSCGSGGSGTTPPPSLTTTTASASATTTPSAATDPNAVQFRRVTSTESGGCGGIPSGRQPIATKPVTVCDAMTATTYHLAPAEIVGGVTDAEAEIPPNQVAWSVEVTLDQATSAEFARLTRELAGTGTQYAVVVHGSVVTAPTIGSPVTDGRLSITGNLTRKTARSLAKALVS